jgi:nucleotide-binding universal stress UspA family protein
MRGQILVCVDFSRATKPILARALDMAQMAHAPLHLFHAFWPTPEIVMYSPGAAPVAIPKIKSIVRERVRLQAMTDQLNAAGVATTFQVRRGSPTREILREVQRIGAGMIILGACGHGAIYQFLVGSVTRRVIRHAEVPVLVVPSR